MSTPFNTLAGGCRHRRPLFCRLLLALCSVEVQFAQYSNAPELLEPIADTWAVELTWFTKGNYAVRDFGDRIVLSDLRPGT